MADKPEVKVKKGVKALLVKHQAYQFTPVMGGFGSSGVPDIVACIKGRFIGIEVKAGKGKPTALQERNLTQIMDAGGIAVLVNEHGIKDLELLLEAGLPDAGVLFDLLKQGEVK
jgi:Holliday junction resolvase